jgi:hypothetical protein
MARGFWSPAASHWTFVTSKDGDEQNIFPPKSVQATAKPGAPYHASDGKTYPTYDVLAPDHIGQPKTQFNAGYDSSVDTPDKRTWQNVVMGYPA